MGAAACLLPRAAPIGGMRRPVPSAPCPQRFISCTLGTPGRDPSGCGQDGGAGSHGGRGCSQHGMPFSPVQAVGVMGCVPPASRARPSPGRAGGRRRVRGRVRRLRSLARAAIWEASAPASRSASACQRPSLRGQHAPGWEEARAFGRSSSRPQPAGRGTRREGWRCPPAGRLAAWLSGHIWLRGAGILSVHSQCDVQADPRDLPNPSLLLGRL